MEPPVISKLSFKKRRYCSLIVSLIILQAENPGHKNLFLTIGRQVYAGI
jgi:hypothetical protein